MINFDDLEDSKDGIRSTNSNDKSSHESSRVQEERLQEAAVPQHREVKAEEGIKQEANTNHEAGQVKAEEGIKQEATTLMVQLQTNMQRLEESVRIQGEIQQHTQQHNGAMFQQLFGLIAQLQNNQSANQSGSLNTGNGEGPLKITNVPSVKFRNTQTIDNTYSRFTYVTKVYMYLQDLKQYIRDVTHRGQEFSLEVVRAEGSTQDGVKIPALLNVNEVADRKLLEQIGEWIQSKDGTYENLEQLWTEFLKSEKKAHSNQTDVIATLKAYGAPIAPYKREESVKDVVGHYEHFQEVLRFYEAFYDFVERSTSDYLWLITQTGPPSTADTERQQTPTAELHFPITKGIKNYQSHKPLMDYGGPGKDEDNRWYTPIGLSLCHIEKDCMARRGQNGMAQLRDVLNVLQTIITTADTVTRNNDMDSLDKVKGALEDHIVKMRKHLCEDEAGKILLKADRLDVTRRDRRKQEPPRASSGPRIHYVDETRDEQDQPDDHSTSPSSISSKVAAVVEGKLAAVEDKFAAV